MESNEKLHYFAEENTLIAENKLNESHKSSNKANEPFWIFGYGSLCWNPGFQYQQSVTGYVKGFSRRFWQGNTSHRGTEDKPGRVATLVEDREGVTWGKAFLVAAGDDTALPYLSTRECQLGGYKRYVVDFYPHPSHASCSKRNAILYMAAPDNRLWLGAAPLPEIARQILDCSGDSGTNVEYLLRLAEFMRDEVPEALDDHLFSLERLVTNLAAEMRLSLSSLMAGSKRDKDAASKHYASRVPDKKLRCVNM